MIEAIAPERILLPDIRPGVEGQCAPRFKLDHFVNFAPAE
jgi:hypothetical protein